MKHKRRMLERLEFYYKDKKVAYEKIEVIFLDKQLCVKLSCMIYFEWADQV